jgi:GcrA cell cycle regulator
MPALWSQAVLDQMFSLYIRDGKSAAETARALGCGITRDAVLGKIQRLGWRRLEPRAKGPAEIGRPAPAGWRGGRGPPMGRAIPLPPLRQEPLIAAPRVWTERRAGECAYPVGEPARPGLQLSCCAPTAGGRYCPAHRALMVQPQTALTEQDKAVIVEIARRAA